MEPLLNTKTESGFQDIRREMRPQKGRGGWSICPGEGREGTGTPPSGRNLGAAGCYRGRYRSRTEALGSPLPQVFEVSYRHFRMRAGVMGPRISHKDSLIGIHGTGDIRVNKVCGAVKGGRPTGPGRSEAAFLSSEFMVSHSLGKNPRHDPVYDLRFCVSPVWVCARTHHLSTIIVT